MTRRLRLDHRCPRCFMRPEVCLCPLIPEIRTRTRIVLLMHWTESLATTNTGRLAALALPNSEIRLRGLKDQPMETAGLVTEGRKTLLLYPDETARELEPVEAPVTLLVPDGTWRQAAKVGRREKALAQVERVKLPPGSRSGYRLRQAPQGHCLSTLEAIARALGILESPEIQRELEALFSEMVSRTLSTRSPMRRH